ncbi:Eco57I restriction-modification methylase domain-containing protein [Myxosarcina sp. GI1]|uniref:Eco57I restriction-modification methylase domain-containing protein n=1 Tax=Myxosarcina sp. GI1 TaxID=1541065 RepID=UPI000ADA5E2A|nr:DNA methyltransferase [Myxosarcina sp. GI1]
MTTLTGIQIEGNLITLDVTADLLENNLPGQTSQDFGLKSSDKLEDEIAIAWGDAKTYWAAFQRRLAKLNETETATSLTREYWAVPLLESLGYQPEYQPKAELVEGQTFAISHRAEAGTDKPPIHIIGSRLNLEQRPPSGTPRLSAHGLMQEYLNCTEHLWGIITNGLQWRLLRDCSLMTRLTYIEFDLEQILNNENYAEFGLFYRLFHRTRLPEGMEDADKCLLEFYHQETLQQGGRVRDRLRDGVEQALQLLGTGFLQHPHNQVLRDKIDRGELSDKEFYRQLLLLIYRFLFLMVAEGRNILAIGEDSEKAKIYQEYYSIGRLRILAERPSYRREGFQDLWQGLRVTFAIFDENWRGEILGLSPLNGDLFGSKTLQSLDECAIDNYDLLQAIRQLSLFYNDKKQLRRVNYAVLDVEELGSVYESLLDFAPKIETPSGIHQFKLVTGSDRKSTGSYYTPPELVAQLIKTALEPVIEERLKEAEEQYKSINNSQRINSLSENESLLKKTSAISQEINFLALKEYQEQALLNITVCDPACGSGHFLLAAARRIGKELARIRTGESQPGVEPIRKAIRDVIQHCIYGVDLNPLAVDLCKVALWIEGFNRGKPLSFLDHRIKCGNSLVGVLDLDCLKEGIPDNAFKPVTGDNKDVAKEIKKDNKIQRQNSNQFIIPFNNLEQERSHYGEVQSAIAQLPEDKTGDIKQKQQQYRDTRQENPDNPWWRDTSACNLWTAAFFTPLTEQKLQLLPTSTALFQLLQGNWTTQKIVDAANKLAKEKRFFHWALEFPEVFENGGFACVLSNPPWEKIKVQEKEFFKVYAPEIAQSPKRKKLIQELDKTNPVLAREWRDIQYDSEALGEFLRESIRFPLTARGDINTYTVFTETNWKLINNKGKAGCLIPPGIATDDSTKIFIQELVNTDSLDSFYDFTNRGYIFKALESTHAFALLTISKSPIKNFYLAAQLWKLDDLKKAERVYNLSKKDIKRLNPNTENLPILRTFKDVELIKQIYTNCPVLENQKLQKNYWNATLFAMFHMTNDLGLFRKLNQLEDRDYELKSNIFQKNNKEYIPLYESKLTHIFNHRQSTFLGIAEKDKYGTRPKTNSLDSEQLSNPIEIALPRYWVSKKEVETRIPDFWKHQWLIGFRNAISAVADSRSVRFSIIPRCGVGNSMPLIFSDKSTDRLCCLVANFNSLILDYVTKQKASGGNLNFYVVRQLPIIPPETYTEENIKFISSRVLELVYTAWDMQPFAKDMGYDGEPFIWDEQRRAILRAELDAYYAKLYGLTRDELRYILDPADVYGADFPSETFQVLKNKEIKQYGEYRTQRLVLEAWDKMFS